VRIFKYAIPRALEFEIEMPEAAQILEVALQHGEPQIWALVEPGADMKLKKFQTFTTGEHFDQIPGMYVGTFQRDDGFFVGHLFEIFE